MSGDKKPYIVAVYDCAGEYLRESHHTFKEALIAYNRLTDTYKSHKKVVKFYNADQCDYDSDGLTDEERGKL